MNYSISRRAVLVSTSLAMGLVRSALAQDDSAQRAPFGLTWDSSTQQLRTSGIDLIEEESVRNYGHSYKATNLNQVLSDVSVVLLSFGWGDKLFRVFAYGRPVSNDPYGGQVIARYTDLISTLTGRYGRPHLVDQRDTELWKAPNEYVASINQGRAARYAAFSTDSVQVELSIRAQDSNTAFYAIIFEYKPGLQNFEQDKRSRERNAL